MSRKSRVAGSDSLAQAGWLALGSPLVALIAISCIALLASTPPVLIWDRLHDSDVREAIALSLRTSLVSLALIFVFGSFLALAMQRKVRVLTAGLELLVTIPAVMPPSVAGLALLLAFGINGPIGGWLDSHGVTIAFTSAAVVMAQVFVASPFYVREAGAALRAVDTDWIAAAKIDGANGWAIARFITMPIAWQFLLTGLILAWSRALAEFGATILFAGNLKGVTQTMPLAIYLGFESNIDQAKALAVILLAIAIVLLCAVRLFLGRRLTLAH